MSSKQYFVNILSNFRRTVLYTGITENLVKRVWQHKNNLVKSFSQKYFLHDLLYYEVFNDPTSAIEREKQLKGWTRAKKDTLIQKFNPELRDLYKDII
ncbi:MAG: GIY-YIG nuclease family protein [Candidatus Daviesbacteria bacterium]|nr:GIY-YIG nuclease family protein [Candidatus Daviesbacteria bacterium]